MKITATDNLVPKLSSSSKLMTVLAGVGVSSLKVGAELLKSCASGEGLDRW